MFEKPVGAFDRTKGALLSPIHVTKPIWLPLGKAEPHLVLPNRTTTTAFLRVACTCGNRQPRITGGVRFQAPDYLAHNHRGHQETWSQTKSQVSWESPQFPVPRRQAQGGCGWITSLGGLEGPGRVIEAGYPQPVWPVRVREAYWEGQEISCLAWVLPGLTAPPYKTL